MGGIREGGGKGGGIKLAETKRERKSKEKRKKKGHTSVGRITRRICSIELRSGLKPPCIVNIFSSMIAAIGKQLKQSVNVFHSLMLYRLLHSS